LDDDVEAVIVAGGLGSRLLPLTTYTPKHLLPVAGVPLVVHQIAKLAAAGARHVVLATSYQADKFAPELGDGGRWGVRLTYVTEEEPLGTGGAIRNVVDHLDADPDEPVVVLNGDILSGHDLRRQLKHHDESGADVTLHLVEVGDARAYGCVPTDDGGRVLAFVEKSPDPVSHQINAGCYLFARRLIDEIPAGVAVSVERETFPGLLASGRLVQGYVDRSYWIDVGTPASLVRASVDLVRGLARSPAYEESTAEAWVAPTAEVHPNAVVIGGSSVGPCARIGDRVVVDGSLVCADADLASGVRLVDSVVGPAATVGRDTEVRGAVIGDGARVGAGCELHNGLRLACGVELAPGSVRFSP
jgi:mannose-1-phosphate guanylyltransferase